MASHKAAITIKDIAKLAEVSTSAVSMVINGREGLSDATREKILRTIKETNYYPNASSQRLVHRRSFNVAYIYPLEMSPFSDFFYSEVAEEIVKELTKHHLNVVFAPLLINDGVCDVPEIISKQDADAAILLHDAPDGVFERLDDLGIPCMLLDWQRETNGRANIDFDNVQSTYMAVKYLIKNGHTRIALLGSDHLPHFYLRCLVGYQKALDEENLPINAGWMQTSVNDVPSAITCLKQLIEMQPPPTAICCINDMFAVYALNAAATLKIPVPEKLSFIGKDNISISSYTYPGLTTVSYNKRKVGKQAAHMLLRMLAGETVNDLPACGDSVVERESVARISTE